jgi:hypothetical protein
LGFVPEIYNGKIYTVPGFEKLTFIDEESFNSAHNNITKKTINSTLSIYFMAKNNLDGRSWHNTQLKRDAILVAQSAVQPLNIFTDRAALLTNVSKGKVTFNDLLTYNNVSKKIINEPEDLILTQNDLPRGKIIDIE